MICRKRFMVCAVAGLLAVMMAMPAYGATKRKKITSITLDIQADIEPGTEIGQEDIEIESGSKRFEVDGYEVLNQGFTWGRDMTPQLRITLTAQENYYFVSLAKDKVVLKGGATPVKATRQDSGATLLLDVKLPSLQNAMSSLENVVLSDQGIASWPVVVNASGYEVRVCRNGKGVGEVMTTTAATLNCRERMTKGDESYTVRVRSVNEYDKENKGEWVESPSVYISSEQAAQFRENPDGGTGKWEQNQEGRWIYRNEDGTFTQNGWKEIAGKWYFFDPEGLMQTGWIQWDGKEYYCSENGDMLTDCLTPDSYLVGEDGAKIAQ